MVQSHGDHPYFLNPVMASCQLVNVSREGEEPGLWDASEDCRLLSEHFMDAEGRPLNAEKRRRWCDDPAHLESVGEFDSQYVYTFHMWQHVSVCGGWGDGWGH